jgi:hypothetical protein
MTIGDLYNAQNVMVGQAACLIAPGGTPMPDPSDVVLSDPFSLTPWPAPWVPVGATDQGWTFASNKTTQDISIEEQSTPVLTEMTAQTMQITGAMSEDIDQTLKLAYNMTQVDTPPTSTDGGYSTLALSDNIIEYAVALIMANPKTLPRWLYIPTATCLGNVSAALRRAAAKRMYTATFSSTCESDQIIIVDWTSGPAAAATLTSLAPNTGTSAGGTPTVLTGTNFVGSTGVTFGGTAGTAFSVISSTTIHVTTPAHATGAVPVVVQNPAGNGTLASGFTYS